MGQECILNHGVLNGVFSNRQPGRLPGNIDVRYAWVQLLTHCLPRLNSDEMENSNETVNSNVTDHRNRILEHVFGKFLGIFADF